MSIDYFDDTSKPWYFIAYNRVHWYPYVYIILIF